MSSKIEKEELLLSVFVADVIESIVTEFHPVRICEKKIRFGSPLVEVRELSQHDDSFGQLDDTIPIADNSPDVHATCILPSQQRVVLQDQIVPNPEKNDAHSHQPLLSNDMQKKSEKVLETFAQFSADLEKHEDVFSSERLAVNHGSVKKRRIECGQLIDSGHSTSEKSQMCTGKVNNDEAENSLTIIRVSTEHDFSTEAEYKRYLCEREPCKQLQPFPFTKELEEQRVPYVNPDATEDLQYFLIPESDNFDNIAVKQVVIDPLKPEQLPLVNPFKKPCFKPERLLYSPEKTCSPVKSLPSYIKNVDQISPQLSPFKDIYDNLKVTSNTIEQCLQSSDESNMNDEVHSSSNSPSLFHQRTTTPMRLSDVNEPPIKRPRDDEISSKKNQKRMSVDDMIVELMLTQAAHSQESSQESVNATPLNLPDSTCHESSSTVRVGMKRHLLDERSSVVPDIDELLSESTENFTSCATTLSFYFNQSTPTVSAETKQVYNWNNSSAEKTKSFLYGDQSIGCSKEQTNDDAVVPFSHQPLIANNKQYHTPQRIRVGLSRRSQPKAKLHPYRKSN